MRPIALKGHERSITCVRFNREGDLIFTASKDTIPCVWFSDNGERLGTYKGHTGSVWSLDPSHDSRILLTGAADNTARLWDIESGKELAQFPHRTPVRCVQFSLGSRMFLAVSGALMGVPPTVLVFATPDFNTSLPEGYTEPLYSFVSKAAKINVAVWTNRNKSILCGCEDGSVIQWDIETDATRIVQLHDKAINSLHLSPDHTFFITASTDRTSKLVHTESMTPIKTYVTERPVNACAISPVRDHVMIGGGQEAGEVTTTHSKSGHFEVRLYHMIYEQELGSIKGHFGPINDIVFHPNGQSFASGAEDGYVRLCKFDPPYLNPNFDKKNLRFD